MKTLKKREVNKEYKRRFSDEQKIEATNIYLDEEVSYCLPDRKYSKLHFMSCTIEEAYKNHYLVKSSFKRKLGLTSFTSLKPSFVKKVRQTRWMLQKESGSCLILLNKYLEQLNKISLHQFMKIWQLKQFNISLQNLRKGQVLLVHDFSQNLLLYAQDEVTAAHWDHEQVTLHPTVVYYVGPCGKMIKEEVIHMTNNRKHIEKTVAVFQNKTIEFLKLKKVPILEILEWTDNAPSQYKSRNCFQRMSLMKYPITRNFFGEKHGKGPSDRAGACFKTYVSKIVKSKKATFPTITIEDLASYCTDNYEWQVECPAIARVKRVRKRIKFITCIKLYTLQTLTLKVLTSW